MTGDYSEEVKKYAPKELLIPFSDEDKEIISEGQPDFIGLNYYTMNFVKHQDPEIDGNLNTLGDLVLLDQNKSGYVYGE